MNCSFVQTLLSVCIQTEVETMAVAPTNALDKRLVELYSEKVTVNLNRDASILSPDDYWKTMHLIAVNNKAFLKI